MAVKNQYDQIEILGVGNVPSDGVSRGVVTNIEKTVKSIKEAMTCAEQAAGYKINAVRIGIAGQHIKSLKEKCCHH